MTCSTEFRCLTTKLCTYGFYTNYSTQFHSLNSETMYRPYPTWLAIQSFAVFHWNSVQDNTYMQASTVVSLFNYETTLGYLATCNLVQDLRCWTVKLCTDQILQGLQYRVSLFEQWNSLQAKAYREPSIRVSLFNNESPYRPYVTCRSVLEFRWWTVKLHTGHIILG